MNWSLWLELLARSAALLLAGEALRRASKAQTAAFRHALIVWVLGLLVLLPVLSVIIPEVHLSLWNATPATQTLVTVQETSALLPRQPAPKATDWAFVIWVAGVIAALAPLLGGSVSVWRMVRRATPFQLSGHEEMPEILLSDRLSTPLTCGFFRPRILLPSAAALWTPARLTAVLRHELAHVRRHDVALQFFAHFVAALWWFQPLVWMARRRLRAESELACDSEAIRDGLRPSEYAAELVAVAKSLRADHRVLNPAVIGMTRGHDLEIRVKAILNPHTVPWSRYRKCVLALAVGTATITASAVSSNQQGGSNMRRTILSALLTSVGMSAATVTGSVHDAAGAAVPDAKVIVTNPETGARQETTTGVDGRFTLKGSESGEYILRIEKTGFGSVLREFDLKADETIDRNYILGAMPGSAEQQEGIHVGHAVAENNLTTKVQPVYPVTAKQARVQGTVELEATISKEGIPLELRVIASPSDDLSESALDAVRQWRYRPTLLNGQPVEIVTDVMVNYTLSN
jgi:TonB family protein